MSDELAVAGTLEDAVARLGEVHTVRRGDSTAGELVVRDTFDGLLRAAGISLMTPPDAPVPDAARAAAGNRALLELARLRVAVTPLALLDELDKTVVRLEWLEPAGLAPRLMLSRLRGYDDEADAVVARLGLAPAETSLADEAVRAAGRDPAGVSAKVSVPLDAHDASAAAVGRVLGALWDVVEANWDGTVEDVDIEFLHDLRVCLRKSRAVVKEFPGVFDPTDRERWRAELKWLQGVTGEVRDLDVYLEDFDALIGLVGDADRAALEPVRGVIEARRAVARRTMVRELRGPRATALRAGWPRYLTGLAESAAGSGPEAGAADAARPIVEVSGARIAKVYRRMVAAGGALGPGSPAEGYHELRKQGKELRYLLELFGAPLHDGTLVKPMTRALKDLQDVLGRHQDREVQATTLRGLAPAVAARPGGPEALIAIGALIIALGEDERAARGEFADAFDAFAARDQRRLVRDTFTGR